MKQLQSLNKQNPKLRQRELIDGRLSLYLEFYLGRQEHTDPVTGKVHIKHDRKKENIDLYLLSKPKNFMEKQQNKETLLIAQEIRNQKELAFKLQKNGINLPQKNIENFWEHLEEVYEKNKPIKTKTATWVVIDHFRRFIKKQYSFYTSVLPPHNMNKEMMTQFLQYFMERGTNGGPITYWHTWKTIINRAIDCDIINFDPCRGIKCSKRANDISKEILSEHEIEMLIKNKIPNSMYPQVEKAFIFSLYCGLRYCDIKALTYANVDYDSKILKFDQIKTKGKSAKSVVTIPINKFLLNLIGKQPADKNTVIFKLPNYRTCLDTLQHWVNSVGINKHITWHCARHSFAVNILTKGANIKTVSTLLGHSSIAMTEKYLHVVDSQKTDAINSLTQFGN
ncbi:hypothetical protein FACS1894199_10890 [Bacteroidia bacterium]|nr:hypothetical protein FACS1894199_10890 [Bacteroidia bacterium]